MRIVLLWLISCCLLRHGTEAVTYALNDGWTLVNGNRSIELHDLTLPSGVYSELEKANITESVLFSYNDVELRWIGLEDWNYTRNITMTEADVATLNAREFVLITFHGLDTLATVTLNDVVLGSTKNMFVRYRFNVKNLFKVGTNVLEVAFTSPVRAASLLNLNSDREIPPACPPSVYNGECHINLLRKMQASFSWDWGLAAPSMGLWKEVYLEYYDSISIRDITYKLIDGPLETEAASEGDGEESDEIWTLQVFLHIETGLRGFELDGVVQVELVDVEDTMVQKHLSIKSDEDGEFKAEVTMTVNKTSVKLWWPNGYGSQKLYALQVKWEDSKINDVSNSKNRAYLQSGRSVNIGFRTIELVQEKTLYINSEEERVPGLTFFFKVNDVPIFMKGSNWIPSHILPEKSYEAAKVKELLQAARDANMNMLRVWGGGVYESNYFYSLADEYGILIWQDMMFACAMYPSKSDFLNNVRLETKHQVQRLQHHASIAIFATNNENEVALAQDWYGTKNKFQEFADDYRKLYVETVTDEINKNDPAREVLTSSPSNANYDGDREFGIGINPQNPNYGDVHFYAYDRNAWKPTTFHWSRFISEYGFQSFPSGWSSVLREGDNLTQLIDHRQHHPLRSQPIKFLIEENLKVDYNSLAWDEKIYLSQLSQAIAIKTETEFYRTGRGSFMNTMGALYWQLNDVWVAPSWSSIEYNGNFKILHHWIKDIFSPLKIVTQMTLLKKLQVFIISDEINVKKKAFNVKMNIYKWNDFRVVRSFSQKYKMVANDAKLVFEFDLYQNLTDYSYNINEYMAEFQLVDNETNAVVSNSFAFPGEFKKLQSIGDPKPTLKFSIDRCTKGSHKISLEVSVNSPAIYLSISLVHDKITKYKLSKNGFMQFEPIQVVDVTFENPGCTQEVKVEHFKVFTLNKFLM